MSDDDAPPVFPLPLSIQFCPGGEIVAESIPKTSLQSVQPALIAQAASADTRLNLWIKQSQQQGTYVVPSLSILAEAAFGRLTGCSADATKQWADAMILKYYETVRQDDLQCSNETDLFTAELPKVDSESFDSTVALLKSLYQHVHQASPTFRPRPCGYVFKRGDIAWNCRTCQTDPTCVICDTCFHNSNHDGHEVYFHRTTPGGCCDCGDAEAWRLEGCCEQHRPAAEAVPEKTDDPMEAVRMAQEGYEHGRDVVLEANLPPRLSAALAVVIGAAVNAMVEAVDGAGVAADPSQWRLRWADEAAKIANGTPDHDRSILARHRLTPVPFMEGETLPEGYRLQLRLHNDDVHTFDEVIDALHDPRTLRRNNNERGGEDSARLVPLRESANEMTHHVDSDGQVTVKTYSSIPSAMQGFRRLKSRGLHCAVVSTAQVQLENRARVLVQWLSEISAAHPAAAALVVHALVQVSDYDNAFAGVNVWHQARMIPAWAGISDWTTNRVEACRKRLNAFPPHLSSSYLTREEAELLHGIAVSLNPTGLEQVTGAPQVFYSAVAYRLPSLRYRKSPHALWGTLPSLYSDLVQPTMKHPLLHLLVSGTFEPSMKNHLSETIFVVDTDLRKQQETERITTSVFPHKLPGLNMISGIGAVRLNEISAVRPPLPSPMDHRHLLATCSFRAPISPILILLLLDPYPTKQMRAAIHALFLSLLTDSRFRSRFAAAIGIAYRPLTTLFCAGVGTEADTPLHFTVQILTAGSLVRALGSAPAVEKLLLSDQPDSVEAVGASIGVFVSPISHTIVRCIQTNLLGSTKEVNMILTNTSSGNDDDSQDNSHLSRNDNLLPALTYVAGEHPLLTPLPAAPDDGFLDSRSTRHKRLPHLLRDLEYVIETPGTAIRLLLPQLFPVYQGPPLSARGEDVLSFPTVYARMLRLAQGMDPQKRKISGGHVEYEQNRWLEAFGLSLNLSGTRDALAESPISSGATSLTPVLGEGAYLSGVREASGNLIASLLREIKCWLYKEGMLETGLLVPPAHGSAELAQAEALQRSTLHVTGSPADSTQESDPSHGLSVNAVALSCATGIKMTEAQLNLIESALKADVAEKLHMAASKGSFVSKSIPSGPVMADWLRVPHSPLAGDSLSWHIPLHRALAKCVKSLCSVIVPDAIRAAAPGGWWKLPVLDSDVAVDLTNQSYHPLVPLIRSTLRSSNCRVVWSAGPECSSQEAQRRRARSRAVSANIAVAKILHSLADHPIRCIAAAMQVERHLWARNGSSVAGMAMNYASTPLCRSFRDLDILLVQLSAAGMTCGLGPRRVFGLLLSRFSMDGYLCDPERRNQMLAGSNNSYGHGGSIWVNPPRLQDSDHAVVLSESFFSTVCVLVSELPPPPPHSPDDDTWLRQTIRRELIHALAAEPRSHSEAMTAASAGISRREEVEGGTGASAVAFREVFSQVLRDIAHQKNQRSSRASTGPATFELKASCCDEYDPTFFHLRRQEHQHAMDVVARLRKQKNGTDKDANDRQCLPLVCAPPKAHPRFLPCRLLLHLQSMDAAIRRSLLFALTNGSWLPPTEPVSSDETMDEGMGDTDISGVSTFTASTQSGDINVTAFSRRLHAQTASSSSFQLRRPSTAVESIPFSQEVVAASSVSFLEVLQLLTLQVHTLEECASLHRTLPDLDDESRALSSGLSINSYLNRLVWVPESLVDVWALKPFPDGPLPSNGSGECRGSILGFLIALYEHRADHAALLNSEGADGADDGHGGARTLATSGLKWLLRFVHALVDGAPSVGAATKSATTGIPIQATPSSLSTDLTSPSWTIDELVRSKIRGMLTGLPDLWPQERIESSSSPGEKGGTAKTKEAGKAAQQRLLEMMKKKQAAFAATIAPTDEPVEGGESEEADLCIICRCDDTDGETNGPLGYLAHVQRSRVAEMRTSIEAGNHDGPRKRLISSYRVVGHMGCQLRETEAMDSKPLTCLPKGSVVTLLQTKVSSKYDVMSRRVLVRHVAKDPLGREDVVTEGWASVQSSQGYVILSPLAMACYTNTSWGVTRPVIKQCGHAAHLKCVETHTLSLHQRAAGEQPYDGRFAANISEGEFLCPLCKQLSNILIPRDSRISSDKSNDMAVDQEASHQVMSVRPVLSLFGGSRLARISESDFGGMGRRALRDFGSQLYNAMTVPWERASRKRMQLHWHPSLHKWDYEDNEDDDGVMSDSESAKSVLRLMRQQLIAWAAVGHSAASSEACARGVEEVLPFGTISQTSDPWPEYSQDSRDTHPMLLELKRTLTGAAGLYEVLCWEMKNTLTRREPASSEKFIVGVCLADILEGRSWVLDASSSKTRSTSGNLVLWSELTALTSAMPCHVSRDGVLPHRCEARATASAMWALKGVGTASNGSSDEPPAPLAVNRLVEAGLPAVSRKWGTMEPFVDSSRAQLSPSSRSPFRPAVASAFLYKPLLAWDLYTLTGAILSSTLSCDTKELPSSDELLHLARMLLIGRMVQAIVTPYGFEMPDEMDVEDDDCWDGPQEVQKEGHALCRLVNYCKSNISRKSLELEESYEDGDLVPSVVLSGVGQAILPFARSLILMLRACVSAIRDRKSISGKASVGDKALDTALFHHESLTCEDGFRILRYFGGPMPTNLIDATSEWKQLVDRWLVSTIGFELHHGSMGKSFLRSENYSPSRVPRPATKAPSRTTQTIVGAGSSESNPSIEMEIDSSGDGNFLPNNQDESEEEFDEDEMDEAEEVVDFAGQLMVGVLARGPTSPGTEANESEDNSSSGTEGDADNVDRRFAHVSRSPILPYQASTLALEEIGPGRQGTMFDFATASKLMADLSHISLIHMKEVPTFSLIRLPKSFVELYNVVNKIKGRESSALDEGDDSGSTETAICLLTGTVMRSGAPRRGFSSRSNRPPGACTIHARKHGSGIGIFFLVQKCTILLMHNNKSAYSPSIYVDEHGEEDPGLRRGRPLFLNEARYRALELLWRQQGIPREVAQIRSTSDRVIRDNWY